MARQVLSHIEQLDQQTQEHWGVWLDQLTARSRQVAEQATESAVPTERPCWFVLLVPEMAEAQLLQFDDLAQVVECLRSRVDERGLHPYIFFGWRSRITKKPFRYLLDPSGKTYPLFVLPDEVEIQEDDLVGPDLEAEVPSTIGEDFEEEEEGADWKGELDDDELEAEDEDAGIELEDADEEEES